MSRPPCTVHRADGRWSRVTQASGSCAHLKRVRACTRSDRLVSAQSGRSLSTRLAHANKEVGRAAVAAILSAALLFHDPAAQAVTTEQLIFLDAWRAVDRAYVDKGFNGQSWFRLREQYLKNEPMRDREETYAAIRKMLATLDDPFTRFLDAPRYAQLKRGAQGSVTGVGLEVAFSQDPERFGQLLVVAPARKSPAEKAGIQAQDAILAVDGQATKGKGLYDVAELLQGESGSTVVLAVQRKGEPRVKDIALVRERVQVPAVSTQVCARASGATGAPQDAKVGVIRIATFNKQTPSLFTQQLRDVNKAGVGSIVLDLRNNGGGSFPAGVQVARALMDSGEIVFIADTKGVKDIYSADTLSAEDTATPLAVLVNGGTASAAEVLAGAIQDNGRGSIVGERTFGKGLIQSVVPLDEEDGSAVVITVARYQTPAGRDINRVGITPDLPLNAEQLPLDRVCSALTTQEAPRLFR